MRHLFRLFMLALVLVLISMTAQCDRDRAVVGSQSNPPPIDAGGPAPTGVPTSETSKVRLYLFVAGWCGPCKEEIPLVRPWIEKEMGDKKERILPTMVYTAGNPNSTPATQPDAEKFAQDHGFPYEVVADKYGKKYYRLYYKEGTAVPGAVLLKENKEVIKIYERAPLNFDVLKKDLNEALN